MARRDTYLAPQVRLRGRGGEPEPPDAVRRDLLVAYYCIVKGPYLELGADWQSRRSSIERRARLQRQLDACRFAATLEQANPAEQNT